MTNITHTASKESMLSFIRPLHFDTFGIHNPAGLQLLTLPAPIPDKEKKINLNFYFHISSWCLKRFYEGLKGLSEMHRAGKVNKTPTCLKSCE